MPSELESAAFTVMRWEECVSKCADCTKRYDGFGVYVHEAQCGYLEHKNELRVLLGLSPEKGYE